MISCASCHRCHEIWTSSAVTGKQHSSPSSCLYHRATLNYRCLHHSFDQADQNSRSDSKSSHGVRRIIIMVITMMMKIIILMIMRIDGEVQPWCRTNAILEIRSPAQITSGARPHLHHHYHHCLRHCHRHQHHHYLRHYLRHQHHNRNFTFITILGFIVMPTWV